VAATRTSRTAALVAIAAALATGCGSESEPQRTDAPRSASRSASQWASLTAGYGFHWDGAAATDGARVGIEEIDGRPWLAVDYRSDEWTALPLPGVFTAPRLLPQLSNVDRRSEPQVVLVDGRPLRFLPQHVAVTDGGVPRPGTYSFVDGRLCIVLPDGVASPRAVRHLVEVPVGAPDGDRWRIDTGLVAGDGFVVVPGTTHAVELEGGSARRVSFVGFAEQPTDGPGAGSNADAAVTLRVSQDGRELWRRVIGADDWHASGRTVHGAADLADTDASTTIEFAIDGPITVAGFLAPVVGPQLDAERGARALDGRPNVVVFLADTFRADGLRAHRRYRDSDDDFELTALEAFAAGARRFENTWSPSTWTLPAHASLFTSLLPRQHGVRTAGATLPKSATTLAEVMRAAGYRTIAVTEGAFVTSSFGLAQGFEAFLQGGRALEDGLANALEVLDTGDGRPTFLFVQTYLPHNPWRPTPTARATVGLGASEPTEEQVVLGARAAIAPDGTDWDAPDLVALRRLYRAQSLDFDRAFDAWLEAFDAHGWRDASHLFFTSDHGESFGHHDWLMHIGPAYEVLTRVPLLWSGPGVEPGVESATASLVDLAPTIARLVDAPVPDAWDGLELGRAEADRLAWSSWMPSSAADDAATDARLDGRLVVTDGVHKLHLDEDGTRVERAFHLVDDPDEADPLADDERPRDLVRRALERVGPAVERRLPDGARAETNAQVLERLRALGYLRD